MSNWRTSLLILGAMAAGLLAAPPLFAETKDRALRAPLNIIPPILRAPNSTAPRAQDKLAPRTITRQSARAVRNVAPLPQKATAEEVGKAGQVGQAVQVGQLGALQDAAIGLEAGYGDAIWAGSRLAYVMPLLARLPTQHNFIALRDMEVRLHRSRATAPEGAVRGMGWFGAKLYRLLALGDNQAVLDLAQLTGAARGDAYVRRALVQAHLGQNNGGQACAVPAPKRGDAGRRTTRAFFLQLVIYCHLQAGKPERAASALAQNQKTLAAVPLFRDLATALSQNAEAVFENRPVALSALDLHLLRLAHIALPATANTPAFMDGAIMANEHNTPDVRLAAAHRLLVRGVLSPRRFGDFVIYFAPNLSSDFSKDKDAAENAPPALALFRAVRALANAPKSTHPALTAQALQSAATQGFWRDMVLALAPYLRDLAAPNAEIDAPAAAPRIFAVPFFEQPGAPLISGPISPPITAPITSDQATHIAAALLFLEAEENIAAWIAASDAPDFLATISNPLSPSSPLLPEISERFTALIEAERIGDLILAVVAHYGDIAIDAPQISEASTILTSATLSDDAARLARARRLRQFMHNRHAP